jgi:hypothetical protein
MPLAVGHLRYNPTAPSVERKAWWCILDCGPGWFWWYRPQLHRELPGRWIQAVDRDRVFEGQRVDRTPHLAYIRPALAPPAWGPHISITRGEKPKANLDVWNSQAGKNPEGPRWVRRGAPFEFEYQISPESNGHHWLLLVQSEKLGDLREFYGLRREPYVQLHLTFAIQTD